MKQITDQDIRKAVEGAMSGIYLVLQTKMGIKDGGIAGIVHSGDGYQLEDQLFVHFKKYVATEMKLSQND